MVRVNKAVKQFYAQLNQRMNRGNKETAKDRSDWAEQGYKKFIIIKFSKSGKECIYKSEHIM